MTLLRLINFPALKICHDLQSNTESAKIWNPFAGEADTSNKRIGAVLMQERWPIAFTSMDFSPKNQAKPVYEKELMVVLDAVTQWCHYLEGTPFFIKTDQRSLKYLLDQTISFMIQQKGIMKLLGLDCTIQYK